MTDLPTHGVPLGGQRALLIWLGPCMTSARVLGAFGGISPLFQARGGCSPNWGMVWPWASITKLPSMFTGFVCRMQLRSCQLHFACGAGVSPLGKCGPFSRLAVCGGYGWCSQKAPLGPSSLLFVVWPASTVTCFCCG